MSLDLRGICYRYPQAKQPVLAGIDLLVPAGSIVGLRGESGAGKSTLLRIAALMLRAEQGELTIAGTKIGVGARIPATLRRQIGVVPQAARASADPRRSLGSLMAAPLAFAERALLVRPQRYRAQLEQLCEAVELHPRLLQRRPAEVSDGQLQRVLLARALALDPKLLVCDEPTAQLDAATTKVILRLLASRAQQGAAVLVASHDSASLDAICQQVVDLADLQPLSG